MQTETETTELVPAKEHGIVGLADSIDKLKAHFEQFTKLKQELLVDADYYQIKLKNGQEAKAIGKSGWYKFGVAFNISTFVIKESKEWLDKEKNLFAYHMTIQGTAPNGRVVQDVGSCDNTERDRKDESEHVIRAMAATRAKERVYITMLGAPEKSAEDENSNKTNGNGKFCTCAPSTREATADFKGCRTCKKLLSPLVAKELAK